MIKYSYYKLSKLKKIRYLKHDEKNNQFIVFLHGFMSDLEGKKPKQFLKFAIKKKSWIFSFRIFWTWKIIRKIY